MATRAYSTPAPKVTPERLLLAAILHTMKPARQAAVLALIGEEEAENVISIRSRVTDIRERNRVVREARRVVEAVR